jgi:multidrug resistance efflux pump
MHKKLYDKGVISRAEWDRIVSAYEVAVASKQSAYYQMKSASANVTEASDNLKRTTIFAPAMPPIQTALLLAGHVTATHDLDAVAVH